MPHKTWVCEEALDTLGGVDQESIHFWKVWTLLKNLLTNFVNILKNKLCTFNEFPEQW